MNRRRPVAPTHSTHRSPLRAAGQVHCMLSLQITALTYLLILAPRHARLNPFISTSLAAHRYLEAQEHLCLAGPGTTSVQELRAVHASRGFTWPCSVRASRASARAFSWAASRACRSFVARSSSWVSTSTASSSSCTFACLGRSSASCCTLHSPQHVSARPAGPAVVQIPVLLQAGARPESRAAARDARPGLQCPAPLAACSHLHHARLGQSLLAEAEAEVSDARPTQSLCRYLPPAPTNIAGSWAMPGSRAGA